MKTVDEKMIQAIFGESDDIPICEYCLEKESKTTEIICIRGMYISSNLCSGCKTFLNQKYLVISTLKC
jgi:hypothetical protein